MLPDCVKQASGLGSPSTLIMADTGGTSLASSGDASIFVTDVKASSVAAVSSSWKSYRASCLPKALVAFDKSLTSDAFQQPSAGCASRLLFRKYAASRMSAIPDASSARTRSEEHT